MSSSHKGTPPSPHDDISPPDQRAPDHSDLADDEYIVTEEDEIRQRAVSREARQVARQQRNVAQGLPPPQNPIIAQFPGYTIDLVDIDKCQLAGSKVSKAIADVERAITDSQRPLSRIKAKAGTYIDTVEKFVGIVENIRESFSIRMERQSGRFEGCPSAVIYVAKAPSQRHCWQGFV